MSKQCPGKYHGNGIKYINDNEEYCKICQQKIKCKKMSRNEKIVTGGISVLLIIANVKKIINFFTKEKKK